MKYLLFFLMPTIFLSVPKLYSASTSINSPGENSTLNVNGDQREGNMSAIEFKSQDFCRAEAPDFEFETKFSVVSATVYFSGANFRSIERASISSNSLKPIESLKARCIPGSIVTFDNVKVIGPDLKVRTIPGVTYLLY